MKITREADYAIRIALFLANAEKQIDAKTIAEAACVPYRFTLKILRKLVNGGIAVSFRGVNGGYGLKDDPKDITLLSVIEVIDDGIAINACISDPEICSRTGLCAVRKRLLTAQGHLREELNSVTIADILADGASCSEE